MFRLDRFFSTPVYPQTFHILGSQLFLIFAKGRL